MISNKGTFFSGEKDLSITLLYFYLIIPIVYLGLIFFINNSIINDYHLFICYTKSCSVNDFEIVRFTYNTILSSLIGFFSLILYSSFILWKNSNNTSDQYNTLAAKCLSIGFGFLSLILLLSCFYALFIPLEHIELSIHQKIYNVFTHLIYFK